MHNLQNIRRRQTFRSYVNQQMKDSLVTGVPEIASCERGYRRAVKSVMFLLCTAGLFYQTYVFLESFLRYETIQNIRMEFPMKFTAPAVTFCNKNRINRELFCKALPEECLWYKSRGDFCRAKPKLCNPRRHSKGQVFGVPRNMSHKYNISNEFLEAYGPQSPWDFLRHNMYIRCHFFINGVFVRCKYNDSTLVQAPTNGLPYKCFTMYSLLGKPDEEPRKLRHNDGPLFWLDVHPEQYMDSRDSVQMYMYVHDPRLLVNPMAEGIALNGGYSYSFAFTVDCIEVCKMERMMEQHRCVGNSITYPHSFPICSKIVTLSDEDVEKCSSGCREACENTLLSMHWSIRDISTRAGFAVLQNKRMFPFIPLLYSVTLYKIVSNSGEDYSTCRESKGDLHCKYQGLKVTLKFGQLRVQKIFVEPKYQNIELFSYIGGFMGMWLGICLVTFVDFLETVADVTTFAVKKWKKMHGMRRMRHIFPF